jgi:hypothetical protein
MYFTSLKILMMIMATCFFATCKNRASSYLASSSNSNTKVKWLLRYSVKSDLIHLEICELTTPAICEEIAWTISLGKFRRDALKITNIRQSYLAKQQEILNDSLRAFGLGFVPMDYGMMGLELAQVNHDLGGIKDARDRVDKLFEEDPVKEYLVASNTPSRSDSIESRLVFEIFNRRIAVKDQRSKLEWFFGGNDQSYFGIADYCGTMIPMSRLPSTAELEQAFADEWGRSFFETLLRSNAQGIYFVWAGDFPENSFNTLIPDSEPSMMWAWAVAYGGAGLRGRLMRIEHSNSVLCVRAYR